jgi:hypothetical protein
MSAISFAELEGLTGELLPERAVLSTVNPFGAMGGHGHGGHGGHDHGGHGGHGVHHGVVVTSACQAVASHHSATLACIPASTVVF